VQKMEPKKRRAAKESEKRDFCYTREAFSFLFFIANFQGGHPKSYRLPSVLLQNYNGLRCL
jgi:hypothetical protein